MPSLKEVKTRINSVKSTRKITSAMKMVASAKLHHAQQMIAGMYPYEVKLNKILTNFLKGDVSFSSPYISVRPVSRVAIVVLSSNTSLCGAFNSNVIKLFKKTLEDYKTLDKKDILVYPIGKKIELALRKDGFAAIGSYQKLADSPNYREASVIANDLMQKFAAGEIDKVELIYHHFKSTAVQKLQRVTLLPIDVDKLREEAAAVKNDVEQKYLNDYIVEPSVEELIASLLPQVVCQKVFTAVVDSNASEHAARTMAMQIATDNADDLIQDLTVQYNKSRQQAITSELLDIIGGSMK
jgi:F-type H+-transporting ATPase subunit gamma